MKTSTRNPQQLLKITAAVALALGAAAGFIDPAMAAMAGGALLSTSAVNSQGATISVGATGSPISYSTIPEVSNIGGPSGSATVIDTTDLSSTAKEKVMGLMDEGQVSLDINYIPSNAVHEELRTARANKTLKAFKITFSSGATYEFSGYVTTFSMTNAVDQVAKAQCTIEITGAVTKTS